MRLDKINNINFGNLELIAKQNVKGFITGKHKSPLHGFSVEFLEHRLYNQGESTKMIDWKLFARTDKMFVKKYEEETNLRCKFLIDTSKSMFLKNDLSTYNKYEYSCIATASIMELIRTQRDAFGLCLFAKDHLLDSEIKTSVLHQRYLYAKMEEYNTINDNQLASNSNILKNIHLQAEKIHKRSLIIIFSDMFDDNSLNEENFKALQHLRYNKHEVILFHVLDFDKEKNLNYDNKIYNFIDVESGQKIKLNPFSIKEKYKNKIENEINYLKQKCIQYSVDYYEMNINDDIQKILLNFMVKRNKVIKS